MIYWNPKDINVEDIVIYSDILDAHVGNDYRLYGSIDNECEITLAFMTKLHPFLTDKLVGLRKFFSNNGLSTRVLTNDNYTWKNKNIIRIGLNEETRKGLGLSSAILKTIVGVNEGKIILTPKLVKKKIDAAFFI